MKNLNEAILDLKTTLTEEGYRADLVADVAADWDLNPALLARKFAEATGKEVAQWTAPKPVETDYEKIYNAGMRRAWKAHPNMLWSSLTKAEQERTKAFLDRNQTNPKLAIVWK